MQATHDLIVEPIGLEPGTLPHPVDFTVLFGNSNPVELEIGFGKGTFLVHQARAHPETNYLGIEWARWFYRYASDRLRRAGLTNVRTVRAEAGYFVHEYVPDASLSKLHVYFPDPWPKKRHNKRRLIQPGFLAEVERMLVPGGVLLCATDHADYFAQMEEVIGKSALEPAAFETPAGALEGEVAGTNFERKYAKEGRKFHSIAGRKKT